MGGHHRSAAASPLGPGHSGGHPPSPACGGSVLLGNLFSASQGRGVGCRMMDTATTHPRMGRAPDRLGWRCPSPCRSPEGPALVAPCTAWYKHPPVFSTLRQAPGLTHRIRGAGVGEDTGCQLCPTCGGGGRPGAPWGAARVLLGVLPPLGGDSAPGGVLSSGFKRGQVHLIKAITIIRSVCPPQPRPHRRWRGVGKMLEEPPAAAGSAGRAPG